MPGANRWELKVNKPAGQSIAYNCYRFQPIVVAKRRKRLDHEENACSSRCHISVTVQNKQLILSTNSLVLTASVGLMHMSHYNEHLRLTELSYRTGYTYPTFRSGPSSCSANTVGTAEPGRGGGEAPGGEGREESRDGWGGSRPTGG